MFTSGFLTAFSEKCVLIIGDVMLDEYIWGKVQRISPEAPVPVVEVERRTYVAGGAANTAANVVSLGGRALIGGVVGRDQQGGQVRELLAQVGADAQGLIADEARPTTTKSRIIAQNHQVARMDAELRLPLERAVEDQLLCWLEGVFDQADVCVLSDYNKGVVTPHLAESLIRMARESDKSVIVDPKGADFAKYRGASVVTPNVHEAEQVLNRTIRGEEELMEGGAQLLAVLEGSALLVTRGAEGISLFREGAPPVHLPATARNVFDVTGAGDTVVSTLALAVAAGASLEEAARLANQAAGVVVGKLGTATITQEELSNEVSTYALPHLR